jgi:hypothetical protein
VGAAAKAELARLRTRPEEAFREVRDAFSRIPRGEGFSEETDARHFWLQFSQHLGAEPSKVGEWLEGQTREKVVKGDARSPAVAFEALIQAYGGEKGRLEGVFQEAMRAQERSAQARAALIFAYARVDQARAEELDRQLASEKSRRR